MQAHEVDAVLAQYCACISISSSVVGISPGPMSTPQNLACVPSSNWKLAPSVRSQPCWPATSSSRPLMSMIESGEKVSVA